MAIYENTYMPRTNQKYVNKGQITVVIEQLQKDWLQLFLSYKEVSLTLPAEKETEHAKDT